MSTMMLSTPMKERQASMQEWTTLFPDFTTLTGSCLFIKKLIAVSLSSITFIRRIFPEEAYGEVNLNGIKVKILSENSEIKCVKKFINLIRSCYDAVEKKYLEQLSIGICANPDRMDEVIEAYHLQFRYADDECSITCPGGKKTTTSLSDPTVKATFYMLKSLNTISNLLADLPKKSYIAVKLLYYDDVTPPDYEPIGFEPSSIVKFTFPGKTMNLEIGKVNTSRHSFKLFLKSTAAKQSLSQLSREQSISNSSRSVCENDKVPDENIQTDNHIIQDTQSEKVLAAEKSRKSLQCPCGHKTVDDSDMITCLSCERVQHKSCYGFLKSENVPPVVYCVECILHNSDGHISLDLVYTKKGKERQEYCGMRRALHYCLSHKTFTVSNFEKDLGCIKPVAKVLLERLEFEGLISKSSRNRYIVEVSNVNSFGLSQYFASKENDENVEELEENDENEEVLEENEEQLEENADYKMNTESSSFEEDENNDLTTSLLKTSINKVKALSLNNGTPKRTSKKRKISLKGISPALSEELFKVEKKRARRRI